MGNSEIIKEVNVNGPPGEMAEHSVGEFSFEGKIKLITIRNKLGILSALHVEGGNRVLFAVEFK